MDPHEWIRDPNHRGEGLTCRHCGITEAEAEAHPRTAATCSHFRDYEYDDEAYVDAAYRRWEG